MKNLRRLYTSVLGGIFALSLFFACNNGEKKGENEIPETTTSGKLILYTDETVQPITEDVLAVFQSIYNRTDITQVNLPEREIIKAMVEDSAAVAVLPRLLTDEEAASFTKRNISARVTKFAYDAVAFVVNKQAADSIIGPEEIYKILRGEPSARIKNLVFDNPNSSTVSYLLSKAGADKLPAGNVFAVKSNPEVIKYVEEHKGAVGVVGVNWLLQPPLAMQKNVDNVKVLAVKNVKTDSTAAGYYKPLQTHIATGEYPFTRSLYVLNYQGKQGLGMGFAIYVSADDGQRIILKSGLMPVEIPSREIQVRSEL